MAFGDVNIQNTQTTTAAAQPTLVANPTVQEVAPVVIDIELQKMLDKLGLTIEQWNAMSPQEQANKQAEYTQIQQQTASEQAGMGITGLHVEHTGDSSQTVQVAENPTTPTPTTSEQSVSTETSSAIAGQNSTSTDDSKRTRKKDPSKLEWIIKSMENKKEYLKQKMIESGQVEGRTDEEIDQILNNYIEYKTKERLAKSENNLSDEAWNQLTEEEKLSKMNEVWANTSKKEKAINKTISDYALIVASNLTLEEYNKLSKSEQSLLAANALQNQIDYLAAQAGVSDKPESEITKQIQNLESGVAKSIIDAIQNIDTTKATGKYDDIINVALDTVENANNLSIDAKIEAVIKYINDELKSIEDPTQKDAAMLDICLSLASKEDPLAGKILYKYLQAASTSADTIIKLAKTPAVINCLSEQTQDAIINGDTNDAQGAVTFVTSYEEAVADFGDEASKKILALWTLNSGNALMIRHMETSSPEERKRVQQMQAQLIEDDNGRTRLGGEEIIREINQSTGPEADYSIGAYAFLNNKETQQMAMRGAVKGKDSETQENRTNIFLEANPTSEDNYNVIANIAKDGLYNEDIQVEIVETTIKNAKAHLDEEGSKRVHKNMFDAATTGFDAENQDDVYQMMMNSGYTEVQEYVANNIYKLDESIRDWAEEYTKSFNIESVTNAIQTEPPVTNNNTNNYESSDLTTAEANFAHQAMQEIQTILIDSATGNIKLDPNKQLDQAILVDLYERYPIEMAKYLNNAPANSKTNLIKALCSTKSTAIRLAESNPEIGIIILTTSGIKPAIQEAVANRILEKYPEDNKAYKAAQNYIKDFSIGANIEDKKNKSSFTYMS